MTGPELQACAAALARFKTEQTKADLAHYRIDLKDAGEEFEVVFVPNQPPASGPGPRQIFWGGETIYGPEVHYFVSKRDYEILKTRFAR